MDVALISAAAGKSFNYFGMLAAKDYWFDSTLKRVLTNFIMNLIPIARKKTSQADDFTFENTIELCRAFMNLGNRNLVMFPEGSRGLPGEMKPFRKGAARFSVNLNVPIVPIIIKGSGKSWPKGKIFMRPAFIKVDILEPLYPKTFLVEGKDSNFESINKLTAELENRIRNKKGELNVG